MRASAWVRVSPLARAPVATAMSVPLEAAALEKVKGSAHVEVSTRVREAAPVLMSERVCSSAWGLMSPGVSVQAQLSERAAPWVPIRGQTRVEAQAQRPRLRPMAEKA